MIAAAIMSAIGEGENVQFRLRYSGPLPADGCKKPLEVKHMIRAKLHPQLLDVCGRTPALRNLVADILGQSSRPDLRGTGPEVRRTVEALNPDLSHIGSKYRFGDFQFVPLVVEALHMVCELDILFLRREQPGSLISKPKDEYGGDLDNRLKMLLDALRLPREAKEVPGTAHPDPEQAPFFCLLEDDSLITKFQVESDTLLGSHSGDPKDVDLLIRVTIKLTASTGSNFGMLF